MPKDVKGHGSNSRGSKSMSSFTPWPKGARFVKGTLVTANEMQRIAPGLSVKASDTEAAKTGYGDRLMAGMKNKLSDDIAAGRMVASEPKSGSSYYGRALSKTGRAIGETGPHADHETAASATFAAHPNAKSVSTARGHGFDIRFHNRT